MLCEMQKLLLETSALWLNLSMTIGLNYQSKDWISLKFVIFGLCRNERMLANAVQMKNNVKYVNHRFKYI